METENEDVGEHLAPNAETAPSDQGEEGTATRGRNYISILPNEIKDFISKNLDRVALSRLGRTDKQWSQYAIPHLYTRNAMEENSSAVRWAARDSSNGGTLAINREVLRRALEYGGDVNAIHREHDDDYATALHYAAALERGEIVRELLAAGASVQALASGFRVFERCGILDMMAGGEIARFGVSLLRELKRTRWLPLLLPLIRGHGDVVQQIFDAGASARLGVRHGNASIQVGRVITVFHIFATMTNSEFFGGGMQLVHEAIWSKHRTVSINAVMGQDGLAPLHVSLEFANKFMLTRLLQALAAVDVRSALGRTPLMQAINLCAEATAVRRRKKLTEVVRILIRAGADVNAVSNVAIAESPLACVVMAEVDDWARSFRDLKTLLTMLMDNGARINGVGAGPSIIHSLCEKMRQRGRTRSFEGLLEFLVEQGGSINDAATPTGDSILSGLIYQYETVPSGVFNYLVINYGATIRPGEVDEAFRKWLVCPKLRSRSRGYDVLGRHREHITARSLERAWYHAFERQEIDLYVRLVEEDCPPPADASELVAIALRTPNHCLWGYVHTLRFDANYVAPGGHSLLHMIVNKLRTTNWRESQAVKDATFLIDRGMSVCIQDHEGLTALQRLRRLNPPYSDLRLLLHEAKDRERGEI